MASFDLKALSPESIEELGLKLEDLWEVSLHDEIFGPFEALSLKHYSFENEKVLRQAFARKATAEDWVEFHTITEFKKPVVEKSKNESMGSIWIIRFGQKSEPKSKEQVDDKIKNGELNRHDAFSLDDGHTWQEFYHSEIFAHHFIAVNSLPKAPKESLLNEARVHVLEKLQHEHHDYDPQKNIHQANPAHAEIEFQNQGSTTVVSPKLKWAATSLALMGVAAWMGMTREVPALKNMSLPTLGATTSVESEPPTATPTFRDRTPASANYPSPSYRRSPLTQQPNIVDDPYPAHVETHDHNQEMGGYPAEPAQEYVDSAPVDEPVQTEVAENEPQSLDAAMNGVVQAPENHDPAVDQPVVEEVSDF